ncbi:glycosyltransferase [Turicibacter sanguinis]|nr:glycosyltransferase [Turicibacter sanguinis]
MGKLISIIVPCYNEQETVERFYEEIIKVTNEINGYEFEFVYVNDGSKDQTVPLIKALREKDERVCLIDFSRNFGKEAAMLAGMEYARGEAVVIMDVDLQDPPELLPKMVKLYEDGYENIYTRRRNRDGEPHIRSFFANMFYKVINRMSDVEIIDGARDYRLLSRRAVDDLISLKESNRFSKGLFQWVGYQSICLEFDHVERVAGETKWSFMKLVNYAIEGITAFSNAPLRFATYTGVLVAFVAFAYLLYIFFNTAINGNPTAGWSSMVCIMLFLGGVQLIFLGVIGEYIGRIYNEVKGRPNYIVKDYFGEKKELED